VKKLGVDATKVVDDLAATVGNPGAAQPALLLSAALEQATPGQVVVLLSLADGADALVFRTTDAIAAHVPARPVTDQVAGGAPVPTASSWPGAACSPRTAPATRAGPAVGLGRRPQRGLEVRLRRQPRPHHRRPAPAAGPGVPEGGAIDDMEPAPMADVGGHGRHLHDRQARLLAQPAGGVRHRRLRRRRPRPGRAHRRGPGRRGHRRPGGDDLPRLFTADGIHNYFWKARPVRGATRPRPRHGGLTWRATASRTGGHRRDGLHPLHASTGTRASTTSPSRRRTRRSPPPASPRTTSTPTGWAPPSPA
jgi:hydroxymethylglutaryl-CoA synthase